MSQTGDEKSKPGTAPAPATPARTLRTQSPVGSNGVTDLGLTELLRKTGALPRNYQLLESDLLLLLGPYIALKRTDGTSVIQNKLRFSDDKQTVMACGGVVCLPKGAWSSDTRSKAPREEQATLAEFYDAFGETLAAWKEMIEKPSAGSANELFKDKIVELQFAMHDSTRSHFTLLKIKVNLKTPTPTIEIENIDSLQGSDTDLAKIHELVRAKFKGYDVAAPQNVKRGTQTDGYTCGFHVAKALVDTFHREPLEEGYEKELVEADVSKKLDQVRLVVAKLIAAEEATDDEAMILPDKLTVESTGEIKWSEFHPAAAASPIDAAAAAPESPTTTTTPPSPTELGRSTTSSTASATNEVVHEGRRGYRPFKFSSRPTQMLANGDDNIDSFLNDQTPFSAKVRARLKIDTLVKFETGLAKTSSEFIEARAEIRRLKAWIRAIETAERSESAAATSEAESTIRCAVTFNRKHYFKSETTEGGAAAAASAETEVNISATHSEADGTTKWHIENADLTWEEQCGLIAGESWLLRQSLAASAEARMEELTTKKSSVTGLTVDQAAEFAELEKQTAEYKENAIGLQIDDDNSEEANSHELTDATGKKVKLSEKEHAAVLAHLGFYAPEKHREKYYETVILGKHKFDKAHTLRDALDQSPATLPKTTLRHVPTTSPAPAAAAKDTGTAVVEDDGDTSIEHAEVTQSGASAALVPATPSPMANKIMIAEVAQKFLAHAIASGATLPKIAIVLPFHMTGEEWRKHKGTMGHEKKMALVEAFLEKNSAMSELAKAGVCFIPKITISDDRSATEDMNKETREAISAAKSNGFTVHAFSKETQTRPTILPSPLIGPTTGDREDTHRHTTMKR